MPKTNSPYKVGLEKKVTSRAKTILGLLTLLVIILTILGINQTVISGDYEKYILNPLNQFTADVDKTLNPPPTPTFPPIPTPDITYAPTPTPTSKPTVKKSTQPAKPVYTNCINLNIREGEFASNKCYSPSDYDDLTYYLSQYNSAVSSVSFYETKVRISCSNNEFFKTCEQDKSDQQANLDNIPRYKATILEIISRGK